ncbi:MAG: SDR family NAD(P)-dependent oxidoreductase [Desulfobulbaceae bacterium]|jgi:NAD(P)-dependent dehydrogenase (short-subunit alcohol dehydrogenase family)|nr:SDR family NAD(P)-dependent oxidoreductase [Desulfobulbaceae bacterium]
MNQPLKEERLAVITGITGSGRGIGEAMCRHLAQQGLRIAVADINGNNPRRVVFGFCKKGKLEELFREGRSGLQSKLPVNTGRGVLSEAYIHSLNCVVETVDLLYGNAGDRQFPGAKFGLITAGGAAHSGSAFILGVQ